MKANRVDPLAEGQLTSMAVEPRANTRVGTPNALNVKYFVHVLYKVNRYPHSKLTRVTAASRLHAHGRERNSGHQRKSVARHQAPSVDSEYVLFRNSRMRNRRIGSGRPARSQCLFEEWPATFGSPQSSGRSPRRSSRGRASFRNRTLARIVRKAIEGCGAPLTSTRVAERAADC